MTVIKSGATAMETWDAIAHLFLDNQASRALALKNRFTKTKLELFPSMSAYCQELKVISDQLANVQAPISDPDLVLQLISGLAHTEYDAMGMLLSNTKPFPTFFEARSSLTMEESRRARHTPTVVGTTLHTAVNTNSSQSTRDGSYGRGA
ncbi:uncharacterized protein LOC143618993 [Bidens hawaiensis]|uniref:uncharacterized protein LOC143618993 n=1 Tax=Bidens hawaiensis TaxID=980011 RepID=UPI00404B29D7